jgi:hypothetical protein
VIVMRNRVLAVGILILLPIVVPGAQRLGRGMRAFGGAGVGPSQIWRLTSLTLEQRKQLLELQQTVVRDLRDGDRPARREMAQRRQQVLADLERIVGADALEQARQAPRGPLAPDELIYYSVTSLPDLAPDRRAKIDAIFASLASSRKAPLDRLGRRAARNENLDPTERQAREAEMEGQRARSRAFLEVIEALLTRDQMVALKGVLPERLQAASFRPQFVMRLASLTLEQEARVNAVYAAFEDETAADRARKEAIEKELRAEATTDERRRALREENRALGERLEQRRRTVHGDLAKILDADQMKELEASVPGPQRSLVFSREAISALALDAEQQRRIREVTRSFQRETRGERAELNELRTQAKDGDIKSMEMAPLRDKVRQASKAVYAGRDAIARTIADTLTGEQLARLIEHGGKGKKDS